MAIVIVKTGENGTPIEEFTLDKNQRLIDGVDHKEFDLGIPVPEVDIDLTPPNSISKYRLLVNKDSSIGILTITPVSFNIKSMLTNKEGQIIEQGEGIRIQMINEGETVFVENTLTEKMYYAILNLAV